MAALPAGVQYELSSEANYEGNKELVFVKLTDSALKAIEVFLKEQKRVGSAKPKIQFLTGNEGKISIPAKGRGNDHVLSGEATFHFSINSNAEMEGTRGSFECVSSGGARRLESCGPLPRRMHVHANDDSYVATRDRMASTIAAEQRKRIRVIKPNQTDIGHRVNVRTAHPCSVAVATQLVRRTDRPDQPKRREAVKRQGKPERVEHPKQTERPVPPAMRPQSLPAAPLHQQYAHHQQHPLNPHQPQRLPTKPGLTKRTLKERLMQLLALKAFKKLEIYAKLSSLGIKDKERSLVKHILPVISTFSDNCYHLKRNIWNDVREDWPFYSEEDKRTVESRKRLILSPPLSSVSAKSLPPGALPSAGKRPSSAAGLFSLPTGDPSRGTAAAASATVLPDEPPHKKQRISHYRRPSPPSSGYTTTSSSEPQAEDIQPSPVNLKTVDIDFIKKIALRKVFGRRLKIRSGITT